MRTSRSSSASGSVCAASLIIELERLTADYFCYCEVGFSERVLGDHIVTMVREGASDYGCATYE